MFACVCVPVFVLGRGGGFCFVSSRVFVNVLCFADFVGFFCCL